MWNNECRRKEHIEQRTVELQNVEYRILLRRTGVEGMYRTANRRTVECRISNVEGMYSVYFI
jgi:hypothetical protein